MNARWYEGVAGLEQLQQDWHQIDPAAPLFARYEWYHSVATHLLGEDRTIWFCRIAGYSDRPVAIIPAVTGTSEIRPFGQLPALALGWHSAQLAQFDLPLAPNADAAEVAAAMLQAFEQHPYRWRAILWPRVAHDSGAARLAATFDRRFSAIINTTVINTFSTLSVPDPATGLGPFTLKSDRLRSNLSYYSRRLAQQGPVQMRMARANGDIQAFFEEFQRVEFASWKGPQGNSTAMQCVPATKAFYQSLIDQHHPGFETDIALLYCGEQAIAGQFLLRVSHWEYIYKIAYDPAYAKFSPGQLLMNLGLERANATPGVDRVSFVTGFEWQKAWRPIPEHSLHVTIFRSRWRPTVIRTVRYLAAKVRQARTHWAARKNAAKKAPN